MFFIKKKRELSKNEIEKICAEIRLLENKKSESTPDIMYSSKILYSIRTPKPDLSELEISKYTFAKYIEDNISNNNVSGPTFYKRAGIGRKIYWNIINDSHYNPSKETAIACALGLHLSVEEGKELLSKAGYTLSDTLIFDVVIKYCFDHRIYNIIDVNEILDSLGSEKLLRTE